MTFNCHSESKFWTVMRRWRNDKRCLARLLSSEKRQIWVSIPTNILREISLVQENSGKRNQNRCSDQTEIVMVVSTRSVTLANAVLKIILIQFLLWNLFYLHFFSMAILLTTFNIFRNQNTLQIAIHIQKWHRLHFNHWSDENFIRNRAFFG